MSRCPHCCDFFYNLKEHCRLARDHPYCVPCDRLFTSFQALKQHQENAVVHKYSFDSDYDDTYSDSDESDDQAYCEGCNRYFVDKASLLKHLAASSMHNWCFPCSRDFSSPNALNQHARSQVHRSRDLTCPLCPKTFTVPSAIALHIESGACHNISRQQVTHAVQSLKAAAAISINKRIEGPGGSSSRPIISYTATERAWNGLAYECYICHRTFKMLSALNAHLASPAHDANEFSCPKCKRKYKLVSGIIQHIESESCGVAKFQEVQRFAIDLSDRFKNLLKF